MSIERYRVSESLIERVRTGSWNPDNNEVDRGYWLAFREVKKSVKKILNNRNAGDVAAEDHGDWYRALFSPSVDARIMKASDLAGYRNGQVYIRNSMHVPPNKDAVFDCMPSLFDLLRDEEHAAVRAIFLRSVRFVY